MDLENRYFVLPDLDKKIDEAIHDAINFFNKKCPYCQTLLFTGHIRNKIHVDHFIPISKGGQNVPWNILPICQNCNSKKNAKRPKLFLDPDVYNFCEEYLKEIRSKYVGQIQIELEKFSQVKHIISKEKEGIYTKSELLDIFKRMYFIVHDKNYNEDVQEIILGQRYDYNLKAVITKHYKIPSSTDVIYKYSATEIKNLLHKELNGNVSRNLVSKTMKEMGFINKLERLNSHETKRVFYVTPILK